MFYADEVTHSQKELEDALDDVQDRLANNGNQNYFIAYVPQTGDVETEFRGFSDAILPAGEENLRHYFVVLIDEAGSRALQNSMWINPDLDRLLKRLPINTTLMIQTAHSLKNFESGSRDLMDGLYTFQLQGRSLESIMEYTDGPEEMRQAIESLPPHHLVYYNFARHDGPEFEVIDEPEVWYMPTRSSSSSAGDESDGGDPLSAPEETRADDAQGERRSSARRESPFDRWIQ